MREYYPAQASGAHTSSRALEEHDVSNSVRLRGPARSAGPLDTAFIDTLVQSIIIDAQNLELRKGGFVAIVDVKGDPTPPNRQYGRQTSRDDVRDEAPHPIRTSRWITTPARSQAQVRVTIAGKSLVFMEPKPSPQHRYGVRLTNGVVEVLPNQAFDVIFSNFSR